MPTPEQPLPTIAEGDIVMPYRATYPMMMFDNAAGQSSDTFVRARKHVGLNVWYSEADMAAEHATGIPREPQHWRAPGIVVFLTESSIEPGYGVRITRVFKSGASARGVIMKLPPGVKYPYDSDTEKLFQPLNKDTKK